MPSPVPPRVPAPHVLKALAGGQAKPASPAQTGRQPAPHVARALTEAQSRATLQPRKAEGAQRLAPHVAAVLDRTPRPTGTVQPYPSPSPVAFRPLDARRVGVLQPMESRGSTSKLTQSSTRSRNVCKSVVELAAGILKTKYEDIKVLYEKPGGWEWWFQGELYLAISKILTLPALAETSVYGNKQKTDFCFYTQDFKQLAIELKCEGHHNQNNFVAEVAKDTQKLTQFQNGYAIQIAISRNKTNEVDIKDKIQIGDFTLHWDKKEA